MKYGYMRVSTQDKQEFTRQEFVLKDYNLDRIFEEKISGTKKASGREAFGELLEVLQKGDEIYFESMSRMARSMQDLIDTTNMLVKVKKVKVVFIKENLSIGGDGLDAMGALVFNIMGAFAQFERDLISDRTKQALSAKKANGQTLGRPAIHTSEQRAEVRRMYGEGKRVSQIAEATGLARSTINRMIEDLR
ncbi:MAG: recombinase family protein [Clostridia bacterium]|nr:recombinase family protein [Clostridia bacterium]